MRYVDRLSLPELRRHYPELAEYDLVEPDVIDDGEKLATFADASLDFVIANHFIEHCEDPIGALSNHLRVLREGGIVFLAVPDKRFTFDRRRPVTPLAHLVRDYEEGPEVSRRAHAEEWVRLVNDVPAEAVARAADDVVERGYSIHFHVWAPVDFLELVLYCARTLAFPLELEAFERNGAEFLVVLSKT